MSDLIGDYLRWHPAQVHTGDIDPMYPVLRNLADWWRLDDEQRAWLVFLHVAWYHPGSTLTAFDVSDSSTQWAEGLLDLPCETERRGHRSKLALSKHLDAIWQLFRDGGWEWVREYGTTWDSLTDALLTIPGNGRWAAYKTAEMLQKVCDLPITAPDAGHRYSSGPRKGLALLEPGCPTGNTPADIAQLDLLTGLWADALDEPDIAQVETSLCDFHSLVAGRYYLGHDIDSMQGAFLDRRVNTPELAWKARTAAFPHNLLGERHNWVGVKKDLNTLYKRRGVMYGV